MALRFNLRPITSGSSFGPDPLRRRFSPLRPSWGLQLASGILALLLLPAAAQAVLIDMVTVGNPGNANDIHGAGYGKVDYVYQISVNEVTNTQYAAFLNAVAATDTHTLYNSNMQSNAQGGIIRSGSSGSYTYTVKSGKESKPVVYVSYWDALRFINWLHNGQPTGAQGVGTTETGAYTLGGVTNPVNNTISRNSGALYYMPSENEWYKAAYYDPTLNAGLGGYYDYATRSNTAPTAGLPPGGTNSANFNNVAGGSTNVGAYSAATSYYGTYDQTGNVWEWNEGIISSVSRSIRGGSWDNNSTALTASNRLTGTPSGDGVNIGFRVASPYIDPPPPVPEPSSLVLLGLGAALCGVWRRKRG